LSGTVGWCGSADDVVVTPVYGGFSNMQGVCGAVRSLEFQQT
jgi:hypothetical protein